MSLDDRFWNKVDATGPCWLWTASVTHNGYGRFALTHGTTVRAHRYAYELLVGPIPDELEPDHLCRVRRCINPDHIELVPHVVNVQRSHWSHCKRGHPLLGDNLFVTPNAPTKRQCRECHRVRSLATYYRRVNP